MQKQKRKVYGPVFLLGKNETAFRAILKLYTTQNFASITIAFKKMKTDILSCQFNLPCSVERDGGVLVLAVAVNLFLPVPLSLSLSLSISLIYVTNLITAKPDIFLTK